MSRYGKILVVISLCDLLSTIFLISSGNWEEYNSFLAYYYNTWGTPGLSTAKIILSALLITVFELFYQHVKHVRKSKRRKYYLAAIYVYLLGYIILIIYSNRHPISQIF